MYVAGSVMYLSDIEGVKKMYGALGYPGYLVPIMGVVKLAVALAILGRFSVALSDLAYAGMFFHLLLAMGAHIGSGVGSPIAAIIGLLLLAASFFTQNQARRKKSPYGGVSKAV